ncbi:MAG: hypothetical protein GEV05_18100 [Betaproteobacteria bacterium]|nr:hypothetical protein [Betaproteobacteria bacterium]
MKIKDVICAVGRSGYMHRDLLAIKAGRAKPNGSLYDGAPMSPGFTRIIEPATIISVMLVLEDGQVAFGDCADVILAGVAGRDPAFDARHHIDYVRTEMAAALRGRDVSEFRRHAEEMDRFEHAGKRLHTAIRYGVSQALLHASALAHKKTMAEVIAREYGSRIATAPIAILASCHKDDPGQLDRVILKRVELADIKRFAAAQASDFVQIKTPDLGSIHNTIEAVLYCKANGMGACLGGTANETDHSTRISCHIGLACQPDFMLSKPGLGADEALMIQTNEMARTLALLAARR